MSDPALDPTLQWHFWVRPVDAEPYGCLCVFIGDNTVDDLKARHPRRTMVLTTVKANVTCLDCLAIIHS